MQFFFFSLPLSLSLLFFLLGLFLCHRSILLETTEDEEKKAQRVVSARVNASESKREEEKREREREREKQLVIRISRRSFETEKLVRHAHIHPIESRSL
jgi:hypothetical protein